LLLLLLVLIHCCSTQLSPWPLPVLRSSQLDGQRLDAELTTMLQEQFMAAFTLFQPVSVLQQVRLSMLHSAWLLIV
jgi:hypothetical protein